MDSFDFPPNITGVDSSITIGLGGEYVVTATTTDGTNCSQSMTIQIKESSIANLQKKDIEIKDLQPGPNNTVTVLTGTLGIGDYEFAIDDVTGPYQDSPIFENAAALLVNALILFGSIASNLSKYAIDSFDLSSEIKTEPLFFVFNDTLTSTFNF